MPRPATKRVARSPVRNRSARSRSSAESVSAKATTAASSAASEARQTCTASLERVSRPRGGARQIGSADKKGRSQRAGEDLQHGRALGVQEEVVAGQQVSGELSRGVPAPCLE